MAGHGLRASATERHVRAPACSTAESPVPRFFFHVRDGQDLPDTEGTELPDVAAARTKVLRTSGKMLRGNKGAAEFWSGDNWTMTVTDEVGRPVLTLRFSGTMHG